MAQNHNLRRYRALRDLRPEIAGRRPCPNGYVDQAEALELQEIVRNTEALIAQTHHRLGNFEEAVVHYQVYLARLIPSPDHFAEQLEGLRLARAHEPLG